MSTTLEQHEHWKYAADATAKVLVEQSVTKKNKKEKRKAAYEARFSGIPVNKRATYRQLNFLIFKFKEMLVRDCDVVDDIHLYKLIKAWVVKKHEGNLTHGDVQNYIKHPSLPNALKRLFKS